MTQLDVVGLFLKYVIILAPILVPLLAIKIVSGWTMKLVNVMGGRGW